MFYPINDIKNKKLSLLINKGLSASIEKERHMLPFNLIS